MANDNLTMDQAVEQLGDVSELFGEKPEEEEQELAKDESEEESEEELEDEDEEEETEEETEEEAEEEVDENPVISWETKTGEKVEVTLSDLQNGYMAQKDYTRKTMALADERRQYETKMSEIEKMEGQLQDTLIQWAIEDQDNIDWERLATENPQQFVIQQAHMMQSQKTRTQAQEALKELHEVQERRKAQHAEEYLLREFPEWKDPKVAKAAGHELAAAAQAYGFTTAEYQMYLKDEPRIARVLRDAGQFRALQDKPAKVEKRVANTGKTLRPGSKTTAKQRQSRKSQEANQRFNKNPTMANALAALPDLDF